MNWIKWVMNKSMRMNEKYECRLIKIKYTSPYLKTVLYGGITLVLKTLKKHFSELQYYKFTDVINK